MLWNFYSMRNSLAAMLSYDSRKVKEKQKPSPSERWKFNFWNTSNKQWHEFSLCKRYIPSRRTVFFHTLKFACLVWLIQPLFPKRTWYLCSPTMSGLSETPFLLCWSRAASYSARQDPLGYLYLKEHQREYQDFPENSFVHNMGW